MPRSAASSSTSARPGRLALLFGAATLLLSACGGDDGPPGLGEGCNPDTADVCGADAVCSLDAEGANVCQKPAGAECDLTATKTHCILGSICTEATDADGMTIGLCLLEVGETCDPSDDLCGDDLRCAELMDGSYQCHAPLLLRGMVSASDTGEAIAGAHVIALDDRPVAVTDVAQSAADGSYELEVPVVRDADGVPIATSFTLRGSADGYSTFPGGLRTALPIHTSEATQQTAGWIIEGTISDIVLIPVADPAAPRFSIAGTVLAGEASAGVLLVADAGAGGISAISDASGAYTIFNAPPGDYEVQGYAADLQLIPASASVLDADLQGVDLSPAAEATSTVTGSIQIVNPGGGSATSVILVVDSTFDEGFARGEVPPGLRAPRSGPVSIDGAFTFEGVPAGRYVVLAAFENDLLVRDPDTSIAGTGFVYVDVPPASTVDIADSFKVTGALAVSSPGADLPEAVSAGTTLTLNWEDDSSEDHYEVQVFDAYGNIVWEDLAVPAVSGAPDVSVTYGGPMEIGMYYQFRATSWRTAPISMTEDLLGVFYIVP